MSLLADLCRLCSQKLDPSLCQNIFAPETKINLLSMILECLPVKVTKEDRYPKSVCANCIFQLGISYELHGKCLSAVKVFDEILTAGTSTELLTVKQEELVLDEKVVEETRMEALNSDENLFWCEYCAEGFTNNPSLEKHIQNIHPGIETTNSKPQTPISNHHICEVCKITYSTSLNTHLRNLPFRCPDCARRFLTHAYACEECPKRFLNKGALAIHMRRHTGEKPYACEECKKRFINSGGLSVHMRTHTGEKPYGCEECQKRFASSHNLLVHMHIHTGDKRFLCDECGKVFITKQQLTNHLLTHVCQKVTVT